MASNSSKNIWPNRLNQMQPLQVDDVMIRIDRYCNSRGLGYPKKDGATDRPAEQVLLSDDTPTFIPENYEPKYAYPLIVWLSQPGQPNQESLELMPRISTRNYFALSLSGLPTNPAQSDGTLQDEQLVWIEQELFDKVCLLRRTFHVHSERIYLAGIDEQATQAIQLVLNRPEWFNGALLLGARFPNTRNPLARFRDLSGKRILIGAGLRDSRIAIADVVKTGRLLHAAGLEVSTRIYDAGPEITPNMLTDIDHWLMQGLYEG